MKGDPSDRSVVRALARAVAVGMDLTVRMLGPSLLLGLIGYRFTSPGVAAFLTILGFAIGVWFVVSRQQSPPL